jgi:glycosyltransferase involved in cell wall biosynthesis/putative flippase GtrA
MSRPSRYGEALNITLLSSKQLRAELMRFGVFLLVGGGSALLNLLIVGILTAGMHWSYLPVALLATEASVFQGFLLNDRLTFHDLAGRAGSWGSRCLRFHAAAATGQLLTLALAAGLISMLHIIPVGAQAIALATMTLFNFAVQRYLTYASRGRGASRRPGSFFHSEGEECLATPGRLQGLMREYLIRLKMTLPKLKPHAVPLTILLLAAALGQAATLMQHPLVATFPDSASYLEVAHGCQQVPGSGALPAFCPTPGILASPMNLIQPFRTPGYPLFLALVFTVAGNHLARVVAAQAVISLLAVLECYVLAFRLSHRRWVACLVASAIGVNLYLLSWERTILSEALSWWSLITLFLCYERFIRRPGLRWGVIVAVVGFAAIMIRPFNIFIPFLLLLMALLRAWRLREFRVYWKSIGVSAALLGVCVLSYMGLNASFNGLFGLSYDPNATLLGKVMEYHLYTLPVPPQYAAIQADVQTYMKSGPPEPWYFGDDFYPTKNYYADNMSYAGDYARYLILHHPGTYLIDSLPYLNYTWLAPARLYPVYNVNSRWVKALLDLSAIELDSYLFLPLLLIVLGVWVWRRPQHIERFLMLVLALMIVGGIALAAMGNYAEYYRVRSPVDWAMVLLAGIVFANVLAYVAQRESQPAAISEVQKAGRESNPASAVFEGDEELVFQEDLIARQDTLKLAVQHIRMDDSLMETDPMSPEISIVLPCLNEEEAIGGCIDSIKEIIAERGLSAEIVVVDNASTDRSAEIARAHGARVVYQPVRGYGNAYLKGFAEARGKYIVMADADNTYDFHEIEAFVEPLRQGYDLVMGNRFSGRMAKGAMTWSHRYIGNPLLSGLLNLFFHTGVRDAHCGMRAFKVEAYRSMRLQTGGMEFASEMVINAAKAGLKITERSIAYHPRVGNTKLRTVRDGWRHLRFLLLYSPTHLFLIPGAVLMLIGLIVLSVLLPGPFPLFGHDWDVHTMILASVITLIGLQVISLGLFARFFSLTEELDGERDQLLRWLTKWFSLERGLLVGAVIFGLGVVIDSVILVKWIAANFGPLNEVRPAIFATTLIAVGTQIMFGSFFLSFLQFRKSLSKNAQVDAKQDAEPLSVQ